MYQFSLSAVLVALLFFMPIRAQAHFVHVKKGCQNIDYTEVGKSVVALKFLYDEPNADGTIGHVGTAWFITPTLLATVSHVTDGMLASNEWRKVEIGWEADLREPLQESYTFEVRLHSIHPTGLLDEDGSPEDVVLLELKAPIAGRTPAKVRFRPVTKDEPVVAVGFRGSEQALQWAAGHFSPPEPTKGEPDPDEEPLQPFLYFEMSNEEGRDRHVLDHGTSGSPVFDCDGNVVAVINGILTTEFGSFPSFSTGSNGALRNDGNKPMRVTPSIGQANNTGLPATVITGTD